MNSIQITKLMNQDKFTRKHFKGVYRIDLVLENLTNPSIIVVNLYRSYKKGSHWIVLHYNDIEKAEHFDSIGNKPDEVLHNLLVDKKITYKYNNKRLQNYLADTCGRFCLYYSFYSCREWTMEKILNTLSNDLKKNEEIVKNFVFTNFMYKI